MSIIFFLACSKISSMKRILFAIIMCIGIQPLAFADFREHFEEAQQCLHQNQYSTAIIEFKKALRINHSKFAYIGLAKVSSNFSVRSYWRIQQTFSSTQNLKKIH